MKKKFAKTIKVMFHGGIGDTERSLTGSCNEIFIEFTDGTFATILVDLGAFQGLGLEFNKELDFIPSEIDAVILTHGHNDHVGRLPMLFNTEQKKAFKGKIYATELTKKVSLLSLNDSANIMKTQFEKEERLYRMKLKDLKDAREFVDANTKGGVVRNGKGCRLAQSGVQVDKTELKKKQNQLKTLGITCHQDIIEHLKKDEPTVPLFTEDHVTAAISRIKPIEYEETTKILDGSGIIIRLVNAGHIAGSASVIIKIPVGSKQNKTLLFSGDIGNLLPKDAQADFRSRESRPFGNVVIPKLEKSSEKDDYFDAVFVETTYGGKGAHTPFNEGLEDFENSVIKASIKRKRLIIPCFALDRAQKVLHYLCKLRKEGKFKGNILVDSPLMQSFTNLYQENVFPDTIGENMIESPETFTFLTKETRDQVISEQKGFYIILSSSGMATGGPIMGYLEKYLADRQRTSFYFMGYMSEGTTGYKLIQKDCAIIYLPDSKKPIEVKARRKQFQFMSAHADERGIWTWLRNLKVEKRSSAKLFLVHGDREGSSLKIRQFLEARKQDKNTKSGVPWAMNNIIVPEISKSYVVYSKKTNL
ncbi:MAG: MBL fold metallo-hydrolase [Candidatus Gracilibacteria bacterium]|nr:MBL fold metallo-hydrolase [Candidatus Gracilibacteria bacterium]MDD2908736.1 MBL fold metallo-hydrolase [Candidatus Gracilibacteria bacterium]